MTSISNYESVELPEIEEKTEKKGIFGFAKDSNHTYTIGVVVFESHIQNDYYGGRTAAPIFKEIVEMLIDEGYLKKIDPS